MRPARYAGLAGTDSAANPGAGEDMLRAHERWERLECRLLSFLLHRPLQGDSIVRGVEATAQLA